MSPTGIDNPFAVPPRNSAVVRSVKALLLVIVCLSAVLALQYGSRRWLLYRLTANLADQPAAVQIQRVTALAELGAIGLPVVVERLAAADPPVAAAAYEALRSRQQGWMQLPEAAGDANHRLLAETLAQVAGTLPEDRRGWAAALLNHSIVETVEHASSDADVAYRTATDLLARLSLSGQPTAPGDAEGSAAPHDHTIRVAQRTEPLPIDLLSNRPATAAADPTDRPSPPDDDRPPAAASPLGPTGEPPRDGLDSAEAAATDSGALRPVAPGSTASLKPVSPDGDPAAGLLPIRQVIVPAHHLTAAPFETYTTRSVIAWLRSVQPKLREAAEHELQRRGLSTAELQLATRLADPDIRVRLALLDQLGHLRDIQPQQWLLWLADDAERDVRMRAIAALGTMDDPNVHRQLAERLPEERDPAVAAQIRRILNHR